MSLLLLLRPSGGEQEIATEIGCTFTYDVDDGVTYQPDSEFTYSPTEAFTYDPCAED